jgi:hypothetical protein
MTGFKPPLSSKNISQRAVEEMFNNQLDFFKEKGREFLVENFLREGKSTVTPAIVANKFLASPDKVKKDLSAVKMARRHIRAVSEMTQESPFFRKIGSPMSTTRPQTRLNP